MSPAPSPDFSTRLIAWQRQHGRHDLPWQQTRDAYRIWLSEIMLQQTQVTAVIPYYQRFLARFPTLQVLAAAPQEAVLESWAGLGYYARARNLHRCAQQVVAEHGGRFPDDPALLVTLAGIGRSTAAAIAAFSAGRRAAILDGNVKRVLCRQFGVEGFPGTGANEKRLWELAEALLPDTGIEAYTQGLMDLGATVCTRGKPACAACPLAESCVAKREGRQHELPTARPKKAIPERHTTFLLLSDGAGVLLARRPPSGIWGGLLVPPEGDPAALAANLGLALDEGEELPGLTHTFTHFRLHIEPRLFRVARPPLLDGGAWHWLRLEDVEQAALPTPVARLLRQIRPAASAAG